LGIKKKFLIPGLYVPGMNESEFRKGVSLVFQNGAYGISLFELNQVKESYWAIFWETAAPFLYLKHLEFALLWFLIFGVFINL